MDRINGLKEYVRSAKYREALGLPEQTEESYGLLAQGEYNINYLFTHPISGKNLLLRVNCGSQMHLAHQIEYEFNALKLLEGSGRTPKAIYVDGSFEQLDHGVLVMEYLSGHSLDYRTETNLAAACLADIHSVKVNETDGLLAPSNPLRAILEECEEMVKTYIESPLGAEKTKQKLRNLLDMGWEKISKNAAKETYRCCINTELNSTNFLINGDGEKNYLIDWEKPLYGDPAQDLGHFLAPTTTFWKTDVILDIPQMEAFLDRYIEAVDDRFSTEGIKERTYEFIQITCLRGITWCAMAWVEYQNPERLIANESTRRKLDQYLEDGFLDMVERVICC